ncbi:MAG: ABC-2 family transporter protein [Oscillospiraceae bacterium]
MRLYARQFFATAGACARQKFEAGVLKAMAENAVALLRFLVFTALWRAFAAAGPAPAEMGGRALLTYTLLSFVVARQLNILTPATSALWEGSVVGRYTRPMPVYLSYMAETAGRFWVPYWLFFSLPALLLAPLAGIHPLPASAGAGLLFLASLLLSVVVGFGIDILFAALAMRLKNAMFMATRIREAVYTLLSGALIPFALFPRPVAVVLSLSPFGAVANAPLSIYVGAQNPLALLGLQLFWAAAVWLVAHAAYKKSEERMVCYGG